MALVTTSLSFGSGDEDIYALSQLQPNFTRFLKTLCRKELRRNSELREQVDGWIESNVGTGDLKDFIKSKPKSSTKSAETEPKKPDANTKKEVQEEKIDVIKVEEVTETVEKPVPKPQKPVENNIITSKKSISKANKKKIIDAYN